MIYINIRPEVKRYSVIKMGGRYSISPTHKMKKYIENIRKYIKLNYPDIEPTDKPVYLKISFNYLGKGKAVVPKITRPDLDNLEKPLLDALSGILYNDDSQVFYKESIKVTIPKNFAKILRGKDYEGKEIEYLEEVSRIGIIIEYNEV
jgi:Holliday junction resolvase RusA-like endonuclease